MVGKFPWLRVTSQHFEQPGCKKTAVGTLCPLESFASNLSKAIDRTAMTTARYP